MRTTPLLLTLSLALPLVAQEVGAPAPDIDWAQTRGFEGIPDQKLSQLRGSVVMLEFWLTYDSSHVQRHAVRERLHQRYRDRGLVVVGLSNEQAHEVDADLQKHPCAHPTAIAFYPGYTVKLIPLTILIDKDGKVAWRGRSEDLKEEQIVKLLPGARPAHVRPGLEEVHTLRLVEKFGEAWKLCGDLLAKGQLPPDSVEQAKAWRAEIEAFVVEATAEADEAEKSKDVYVMWRCLDAVANRYAGVPGGEKARARLETLMADKKVAREVECGKELARGEAAEAAFDFDTAIQVYDALGKRHGGTKAGKAAKEKHKDLMKRGMLGYQHDCVYCKAAECACPSHARKK
ncbi:MAG: TlpA family protein disulfide reductase [Planctomycetes bacterium]|nr:TlpA family protein disulfide reductase [Planctomycetota bacterium]